MTLGVTVIASERQVEGANGAGEEDTGEPQGGATPVGPRGGSGRPGGRHTRADGSTSGGSTDAGRTAEPPNGASSDGSRATDSDEHDGRTTGADGSINESASETRGGEADESRRSAVGRTGRSCADGAEDEPSESEGRAEGRTEGRDDLIHLEWIVGIAFRVPTAGVTTAGAACQ